MSTENPEGHDPTAARRLLALYPGRLPTIKEAEELLIVEAMKRADGNQGKAAKMIGLSRKALNKRISYSKRGDQKLFRNVKHLLMDHGGRRKYRET